MRRRTLIGLAAITLLVVAAGGYTAYWFIAASRLKDGIRRLAATARMHQIDLSWQQLGTGGFPLALRLELRGVACRDRAPVVASVIRVPLLFAEASAWNFSRWRFWAPDGISATVGSGPTPSATLAAGAATADLLLSASGGATAWAGLDRPEASNGASYAAGRAALWLIVPEQRPQSDSDPAFGVAFDAWHVTLPAVPKPLGNPLVELAAAITVRGKVPTTKPKEAATAWRDNGGTADVDHVALRWSGLSVSGSGTFALDRDLQPEGSFSLAIENYPALLQALVDEGRLSKTEAGIADLALMLLAKTGPNGKPQISAPFRMQDGQMFLGPARLGPTPHIDW